MGRHRRVHAVRHYEAVCNVTHLPHVWSQLLTPLSLAQRIEAPVRGGEEQAGSIPDGGPPIRERESELDREIVASAGNREREILGSGKHGQCHGASTHGR